MKYLLGEWSRDWVQAAAARVAEEQPNWSPTMPAPARISNEDGVNACILSSQRGAASSNRMSQLQRRPRTAVCKSIQEAIRKEDMVAIRKVVCFGDHPC